MTPHTIIDTGASSGEVKRHRRGTVHYERRPGCARCGLSAALCEAHPVCSGVREANAEPRPATKTERRRGWGGLTRRRWDRGEVGA